LLQKKKKEKKRKKERKEKEEEYSRLRRCLQFGGTVFTRQTTFK
jgi:hypothetical protein